MDSFYDISNSVGLPDASSLSTLWVILECVIKIKQRKERWNGHGIQKQKSEYF
jgi:hypothetical protein